MHKHINTGLALAAGLFTTANAAQVLHYWDMDTLNAGVPVDVVGGLATSVMDTGTGGLVLENATYSSAYGGAGNYLQTLSDQNSGGVADDIVFTDHLQAALGPGDMDFGTGDFSFSYWSYNQSDAADGDLRGPRVFDNLSGTLTGVQLGSNATGIYNFRTDAGSTSVLSNTTLTTLLQSQDSWIHIAVNVSRSTGQTEIFFNNVSQGTYSVAGLSGSVSPSLSFLEIGAINGGVNAGGIQDAGLDDLAFYDGTLDATERAGLAAGTLTPVGIPEPGSVVLLSLGAIGLLRRRR